MTMSMFITHLMIPINANFFRERKSWRRENSFLDRKKTMRRYSKRTSHRKLPNYFLTENKRPGDELANESAQILGVL